MRRACRKAGFNGPIEVVHTPRHAELNAEPIAVPLRGSEKLVVGDGTFIFYSIFQWNERKGYRKLFRAYYEEFSEKVIKGNSLMFSLIIALGFIGFSVFGEFETTNTLALWGDLLPRLDASTTTFCSCL